MGTQTYRNLVAHVVEFIDYSFDRLMLHLPKIKFLKQNVFQTKRELI